MKREMREGDCLALHLRSEENVSPFTSHVSHLLGEFFHEVAELRKDELFHRQSDGVLGAGG